MIISKTPLRLSLFGGGTDMPEFYTQHPGAVVSFCIDKHIYVSVNPKFDGRTRVSYSRTEIVEDPALLEHDLVRETLKHYKFSGLEIASVSDIPGEGSGLGSSSAFTVGLITALTALSGGSQFAHPSVFAQAAYGIERNLCGHPVGKQDHYAAAYGGVNYFGFNPDGTVNAEKIPLTKELREYLESHVMLFWTGITRKADRILKEQAKRFYGKYGDGEILADLACQARARLEDGKFDEIGKMMDVSWFYKQQLSDVTTNEIDTIYHRAKLAGAQGGKLCGAGGGGFLMMIADPAVQSDVEQAVGLRRVFFKVAERGSHVIYKD